MKSLLFLGLLALAWASSIKTTFPEVSEPQTNSEDQHKYQAILQLFQHVYQPDYFPEYQKVGESYSFEDNIKSYSNPQYVYDFFKHYLKGSLPKGQVFSIFYDKHQKEAIAFFRVLYSAVDFETFYKTAVWGRLHLNEGLYIYALSVALVHRPDTWYMQLPPIYEIYPYYFYNFNVFKAAHEQTGYHFGKYQYSRPQSPYSYPYKSYKYPYYFGLYLQSEPYQQYPYEYQQDIPQSYQRYPYSQEKYQQFPEYPYGKFFQSSPGQSKYQSQYPSGYQQGYYQEMPQSYKRSQPFPGYYSEVNIENQPYSNYLHVAKSKSYPTGQSKYQGYYKKYYGQEVPQGYQSYEKYRQMPPYSEEYYQKYGKYFKNFQYPEENPSGYQWNGYKKNLQYPPTGSYPENIPEYPQEEYYQKQGYPYYSEETFQNKPYPYYGPYLQFSGSKQYPYSQRYGEQYQEDYQEHPWKNPQTSQEFYKKIQKEPFFSMSKQFNKPMHYKHHGQEYPYFQKSFKKQSPYSQKSYMESFYKNYPSQHLQKSPYSELYQQERENVPMEYYQQGVTIDANYTVHYAKYNPEYLLSYFTEDVGLNAYYYYYHIYFPFWMKNEEISFNTQRRGEQFYYIHQQLLARYNLERISNGLGETPLLNFPATSHDIPNGFQTDLVYPNGALFPQRPNYAPIQNKYSNEPAYYDNDTMSLMNIVLYQERLMNAIDSGFVLDRQGKFYSIFEPQGFEILGNIIQCNPESPNARYYGPILVFARYLMGYSNYPMDQYNIAPSVMEQYETSLRDSAFYQLHKRIIYYFQRYKQYLPMYSQEELLWEGVKIQDVKIDKLVTYFDYFYSDLSHVAYGKSKVEEVPVHVRQYRLNHKPFNYYLNVLSEKPYEAVVRVFLGPKYDVYGEPIDINRDRLNFVEMDKFHYSLVPGLNAIQRNSKEFYGYVPDRTSYKELFMQLVSPQQAIESSIEWGFPQRLLLPKGTKEGQAYQMYFIVTPYQPNESVPSSKPILHWDHLYDQLPYGYPFDRPVDESVFYVPNSHFDDVVIYNEFIPEYMELIPGY